MLGLRQAGQQVFRDLRLFFCLRHGVFNGTGGLHDVQNLRQIVQPTLADSLANQLAFFLAAVGHGVNQWQGGLAFGQVIAHVLAHGFGIAQVIQYVVHQLECQAQVLAVVFQGGFLFRVRSGQQCAGVGRCFEQHGRLVMDNHHVLVFGEVRVLHVHQLHHLALGNHRRGVGQHVHDRQAFQLHHHLEGPGIQEITYQHARGVAPLGVGGTAAPAHVGGVHHVVVQQGGGVQEFNDRGQLQVVVLAVARGPAGQQNQ